MNKINSVAEKENLGGVEDPRFPWIFFRECGHGRCPSPRFAFGFGFLVLSLFFFSLSLSLFPTRFTTYFHTKREGCLHFERSIINMFSPSNEVKP
jgi:hypothetical protein